MTRKPRQSKRAPHDHCEALNGSLRYCVNAATRCYVTGELGVTFTCESHALPQLPVWQHGVLGPTLPPLTIDGERYFRT